jgi:hypothetical protein
MHLCGKNMPKIVLIFLFKNRNKIFWVEWILVCWSDNGTPTNKKQEAHMSLYRSPGKDLLSYCPLKDMLDFDWLGIEPNRPLGIKLNVVICRLLIL